jgi:hypothetical protein
MSGLEPLEADSRRCANYCVPGPLQSEWCSNCLSDPCSMKIKGLPSVALECQCLGLGRKEREPRC